MSAKSSIKPGWLILFCLLAAGCCLLLYPAASLGYGESKGPFKNWMQVVDLEGDGDLDVLVSHTRWEDVDLSWAGVGRWINQGDGTFVNLREEGTEHFAGFAGGAADVDQDGDADVFVQVFGIQLNQNQGGLQGGEPGQFMLNGGINTPPAYDQGYRDMGGTITPGDLNGDGWIDAFIAGCCYGVNARQRGDDYAIAPSVSWAWINDGWVKNLQKGHILPMDFLDGRPIRQAALGDLDGDGDLDVYAAVGKPTMGSNPSPGDLVLLNDGAGKLAPLDWQPGEADSTSVALGDVNRDGRLDALVGTGDHARLWINQDGAAGALFSLSDQSFIADRSLKDRLLAGISAAADQLLGLYLPYGSARVKAVFLEDLDGDGDLDALLARLWGAETWWNDGQGKFSRSDWQIDYKEDTGVAVADFDGDGDLDIFFAGNGQDYRIWWNDNK